MRKLYEINADIEDCIFNGTDPETGEFLASDALEKLQMEWTAKIEGVCLYIKDCRAEAAAIDAEMKELEKRKKRLTRNADGAEGWVEANLKGQKFSTARVECSYRKSEQTEVAEDFCEWAYKQPTDMTDFIIHKESDAPNKPAIKKYLKAGGTLYGCEIVTNTNITIK